jgi:ribosomal protein S30
MSNKQRTEERTSRHKVSGHGSTTKAGKVRNQTPKVPKTISHSKHGCPRLKNKKKYHNRITLNRKCGQNWVK